MTESVEKFSGDKVHAVSPASGQKLREYPVASAAEVEKAVARARTAWEHWRNTSFAEREGIVRAIRNEFADRAEEIVETLSAEIGRPEAESWFAEIIGNMELFDYWLANAQRFLKPEKLKLSPINYPGKKGWIEYVPKGVIGLITPWNFPVAIPLRALVPALLAGNAVVWKPSEWSLGPGQIIFDICSQHLPEGVLQIVHGGGETGQAVVDNTDYVVFTGSVATGRAIQMRCAERGINCALELGGKDAAYVAPDANLDRAVAGLVWGAMNNCGQNCASVERIYVHESIYPEFAERYETALQEVMQHAYPQVGPLVNANQARIVATHVEEAIGAGGVASVGGGGQDLFLEPTVLRNVTESLTVCYQETFGPVAPLMPVTSDEEAVTRINNSPYGLTCSLWTSNYEWARTMKDRIHTGVLTVNNHGFTAAIPGAPWVGVLDSGSGVTNSHIALHEMVRPRMYLEDRNKATRELWWYPYNENAVALTKTLLKTMMPGGKSPALYWRLLSLMRKRWDG